MGFRFGIGTKSFTGTLYLNGRCKFFGVLRSQCQPGQESSWMFGASIFHHSPCRRRRSNHAARGVRLRVYVCVCETNPPAHRYSNFVNNVVQIQPARPPYAIITKRNKPQQRLGKINCINFFLCRGSQALAGFSRQAWVWACGCNSDFPSTGEKNPRQTTGQMKIYGEPYCIFYVPVGRWRVGFLFFRLPIVTLTHLLFVDSKFLNFLTFLIYLSRCALKCLCLSACE